MVYSTALERRHAARHREFKSHRLRFAREKACDPQEFVSDIVFLAALLLRKQEVPVSGATHFSRRIRREKWKHL